MSRRLGMGTRYAIAGAAALIAAQTVSGTTASAQDLPPIAVGAEANGGAALVRLRVNLPLLGWITLPVALPPIAQAVAAGPGGTTENAVADVGIPLGSLNVLSVSGVGNRVDASAPGTAINGSAEARVDAATLLGGLVELETLVSRVDMTASSLYDAPPVVDVTGKTYIQQIRVAGLVVGRVGEIPPNTVVPLLTNLPLDILGLRLNLPLHGKVTLNEQKPFGNGGLEVNAVRVEAGASLLNLAELVVDVRLGGPSAEAAQTSSTFACPTPDGFFPHDECAQFWHCSNQIPYEKDCPAGLHWSQSLQRCEWPDIAQCAADLP